MAPHQQKDSIIDATDMTSVSVSLVTSYNLSVCPMGTSTEYSTFFL